MTEQVSNNTSTVEAQFVTNANKPVQIIHILEDFDVFVGIMFNNWVDRQQAPHFDIEVMFFNKEGAYIGSEFSPPNITRQAFTHHHSLKGSGPATNLYEELQKIDEKNNTTE